MSGPRITVTGVSSPAQHLAVLTARSRAERLLHVEHVPARSAQLAEWPATIAPAVLSAFLAAGMARPWSHQRAAIDLADAGRHVVLATGTASGKSLGYLAPVLSAACEGAATPGGRGATAIYLAPTKALAADQLARIEALAVPGVRAATYDGDTPPDERRWVRDHANVVLTNPDLLHHSLLPGHERWSRFLRSLQYVVVDECHVYRGVFGSHVAAVIRRLRRVAARYGASPTFVLASATVSEPAEHASRLIGMPVTALTDDGSPRGAMTFALWEPSTEDGRRRVRDDRGGRDPRRARPRRRAGRRLRAQSRRGGGARDERAEAGRTARPRAGRWCRGIQGGYLPQDRRELERGLRDGSVRGLAATNALELGIDVSGLDAVVMAGWPGRRASLWQQAGRAGRSGEESLAVLVAADDPLDTYLVRHPEAVFGAPVEATVMDPFNPHVLAPHLAAAAAELPLGESDLPMFGPDTRRLLDALVASGILRRRPSGWFWAREDRPSEHISLRGAADVVAVVETRTGRVLGTVDEASSHVQVHTGAVHVHQGDAWVVTELDLEARAAHVVRGDPGWSTHAQSVSRFDILGRERSERRARVGVSFGSVRVTTQVTGFLRRLPSGEVIGTHPLDLPERALTTKAVWWTVPADVLAAAGVAEVDVPGALHAAEHAAIGMLPLVATSDRWDVGGVSTALHPDTGEPTIMVFDGYPGGAGFAERGMPRSRPGCARPVTPCWAAPARRAAPRACSPRSAATATSPCTRPAR